MGVIVQSLRRNLAANFLSRAWIGVLQIVALPFTLKLLGPEGFGLVGVFLTLQSVASIFESAFSIATNREMAQRRATAAESTHDILPVFGLAGFGCGIVFAVAMILLTPLLVTYWITADGLSRSVVENSLLIMGGTLGLQVANGSTFGALLGCDRQVAANAVLSLWALLRTVGALAALVVLGGGLVTYFAAQLVGYLIYFGLTAAMALRAAGWATSPSTWRAEHWRERCRTMAGMIGSGLASSPLEQLDKIVLAHWGGVRELGYYSFASSLAGVVLYVAGPVVQASFPALAASVGQRNTAETDRVFHLMTALMTVTAGAIALMLSLFGTEIVGLWTGNAETGVEVGRLLSYLMIGAAANAVYFLPVYLQLATGRTKPLIVFNAVTLVVMIPVMYLAATEIGAVGVAIGWLAIKAAALFALVPVILKPLLTGGAWAWWRQSILPPLLGILPGGIAGYLLIPRAEPDLGFIAAVGAAGLVSLAGGTLCAPHLRARAMELLHRRG